MRPLATFPGVTSHLKAILGPTNTGKTHLAIERMCAHSSGVMGFPLRLLAREVYDRVCQIKGAQNVALITGEERIEPPGARYFLCTAEAMPRLGGDAAFVALDEAQMAADRERGHIFTDRLLHARGREETMLLGAATLEPTLKTLEPHIEVIERPRFSELRHIGSRKLSRLPPRSAVVAFSIEQVYAIAELLRRYRGGAAVVMGALSPETRNRQVELFQSGEVDFIVATDAVGMGLNLDLNHVAFANLFKFDGVRRRRLVPAEMAQIAGRAGRHQRDGTFGTVGGLRQTETARSPSEFSDEEVYAIEEHRFAPLTHLYWREPEPRFESLTTLIADLETPPADPAMAVAPEAIDLAVLRRLAEEPFASQLNNRSDVKRFWDACSLPDFKQQGVDMHARFVARLWRDLQRGSIGADYVAARISELDNVQGDIDTLQGRIAAIRTWSYICQRPDWVLAKDEMAARARTAERRLSDALHQRLTERFVNRRMKAFAQMTAPDVLTSDVQLTDDGMLEITGEPLGQIKAFSFIPDNSLRRDERRMVMAVAEKALSVIRKKRARILIDEQFADIQLKAGKLVWEDREIAVLRLHSGKMPPRIDLKPDVKRLPIGIREQLVSGLNAWIESSFTPLEPLRSLAAASQNENISSQMRGLLQRLISGNGYCSRQQANLEHLSNEDRKHLREHGITFGALDVYVPALLKPAARSLLNANGMDERAFVTDMPPSTPAGPSALAGYRVFGHRAVRIDMAEKLLRSAHDAKGTHSKQPFAVSRKLATSIGLDDKTFARILKSGGFRQVVPNPLSPNAYGPPSPTLWLWSPRRRHQANSRRKAINPHSPLAELAELFAR